VSAELISQLIKNFIELERSRRNTLIKKQLIVSCGLLDSEAQGPVLKTLVLLSSKMKLKLHLRN
jgi:hypothetical protein